MRSIESSGKSVDEAIFRGLEQLQISLDEVDIEIIQNETKGVFGIGAKPAVVKLTEKEPEDILAFDPTPFQRPQRERRERDDRRPRRDREVRESRGQRENRLAREAAEAEAAVSEGTEAAAEAKEERAERPRRDRAPRENRQPKVEKPVYNYSEEAAKDHPAAIFLAGLLEKMGVEAKLLLAEQEEGIRIRIDSTTMGILIGHRGETLDALQYLTSLVVNRNRKEEGYTRVTLDTEDYRDKREETLTRLARKIASQVKATGRARTLEPMNPYERRVLHSALQNHPYVTTHSEGEEPNRRVVISPKR
ncbi:MAG: protein jag [Clostridia bacterium]|nr:protein jag [Clostridia bacterium]